MKRIIQTFFLGSISFALSFWAVTFSGASTEATLWMDGLDVDIKLLDFKAEQKGNTVEYIIKFEVGGTEAIKGVNYMIKEVLDESAPIVVKGFYPATKSSESEIKPGTGY